MTLVDFRYGVGFSVQLRKAICEISNGTATDRKKRSDAGNQLVPVLPYPKIQEYKAAVTSGCELDFVCSPCSKKEQTHRSEADIDVDDFAANWEMGFDISDIHDNVTDEDLDSTRAEGNGNVDDDGAIDGDHITGNEMDDTTGNGDDDGDIDGPPDME
ncbi:hypothetical protein DPMN_056094 [Dreissena polymorpha]|uniref:Uncharacterized protein n=1 Tax=Dreissena polymorpha TaxID=45954 RepID=A0A9D4CR36_DREPO|nr:hypothetical protein DPMN_056094 [Dreissena polymorpha]